MKLPDVVKQAEIREDFVFWAANVNSNATCDFTRITGINIHDDNEHITFYLPKKLFRHLKPNISANANISLLMASIKDFQSYQVKGTYISHTDSTKENIAFCKSKLQSVMEIMSAMGLNAKLILGYLNAQSSVAVTMFCNETFVQTPKPGTGYEIKE